MFPFLLPPALSAFVFDFQCFMHFYLSQWKNISAIAYGEKQWHIEASFNICISVRDNWRSTAIVSELIYTMECSMYYSWSMWYMEEIFYVYLFSG